MRRATPWCNHYSGMHRKESCDAGVRFDSLPGYGIKGFLDTCPCFARGGSCEKAVYPTQDELAAAEIEMAKRFANIGKARAAIVESLGGPWKRGTGGAVGEIDCPACGALKSLAFSRSGYNGHIHAACRTEGCVRWME